MSDEQKETQEQPPYTGNLFSWRFSLFGLVLILVLVAIMAYRHYILDVPFGFNEDATIEVVPDSLLQKEEPATQDQKNMELSFYKYQGTGNDFVIIDNRQPLLSEWNESLVSHLCDRRFGIGADGLILLQNHPDYDFQMVYFNADGREGSMCGNGGRCVVAFAKYLGVAEQSCNFLAVDGPHEAKIRPDGWVELKMSEVNEVEKGTDYYYLNTGSPHYVQFVENVEDWDVVGNGKAIRYSDRFKAQGTNVNFVQNTNEGISVATYERGVEDETLSCGTGVTAAAMAYHQQFGNGESSRVVKVKTKGGQLEVRFTQKGGTYVEVWLCGPAQQVFSGKIHLKT